MICSGNLTTGFLFDNQHHVHIFVSLNRRKRFKEDEESCYKDEEGCNKDEEKNIQTKIKKAATKMKKAIT